MSLTTFHVTSHAIDRYIERVERCSRSEARDRLDHAASISIPATGQHLRRNRGLQQRWGRNAVYRFCPVESLLLILRHKQSSGYSIITVAKLKP